MRVVSLPGQTLQQSVGFRLTAVDSGQSKDGHALLLQFTVPPDAS